jgi:hypothetical protein
LVADPFAEPLSSQSHGIRQVGHFTAQDFLRNKKAFEILGHLNLQFFHSSIGGIVEECF